MAAIYVETTGPFPVVSPETHQAAMLPRGTLLRVVYITHTMIQATAMNGSWFRMEARNLAIRARQIQPLSYMSSMTSSTTLQPTAPSSAPIAPATGLAQQSISSEILPDTGPDLSHRRSAVSGAANAGASAPATATSTPSMRPHSTTELVGQLDVSNNLPSSTGSDPNQPPSATNTAATTPTTNTKTASATAAVQTAAEPSHVPSSTNPFPSPESNWSPLPSASNKPVPTNIPTRTTTANIVEGPGASHHKDELLLPPCIFLHCKIPEGQHSPSCPGYKDESERGKEYLMPEWNEEREMFLPED